MRHRYTRAWMLAEAVKSIQSADRLQGQFFQLGQVGELPFWEPPGPARIVRLEIPYGRFERRIRLPDGGFQLAEMRHENGCLKLTLERLS